MENALEQQAEYIASLEEANKLMSDEQGKLIAAHRKLRKLVEDAYRQIKEGATDVPDEMIISSWNSAIPEEAATDDIMVALRGSRKVMNSIMKQTLDELVNVLDEVKKEGKQRK